MRTLKDIKEGDLVVLHPGDVCARNRLITVDRITKTQIICKGIKFRRDTGYRIGRAKCDMTRIEIPTEDTLTEIKRQQAIDKIKQTNFEIFSLDDLMAILQAIREARERED